MNKSLIFLKQQLLLVTKLSSCWHENLYKGHYNIKKKWKQQNKLHQFSFFLLDNFFFFNIKVSVWLNFFQYLPITFKYSFEFNFLDYKQSFAGTRTYVDKFIEAFEKETTRDKKAFDS